MTEKELQNINIGDKIQNICPNDCSCSGQGQIGIILNKDGDENYEIRWNNGKTTNYGSYSMKARTSISIVSKNEFNILNGGLIL
jgi:hypothetical protein